MISEKKKQIFSVGLERQLPRRALSDIQLTLELFAMHADLIDTGAAFSVARQRIYWRPLRPIKARLSQHSSISRCTLWASISDIIALQSYSFCDNIA
jgi:hypothetical protein